jgi:hypothetical protein
MQTVPQASVPETFLQRMVEETSGPVLGMRGQEFCGGAKMKDKS